jgi:xanthine dehydrogenase accessory factor
MTRSWVSSVIERLEQGPVVRATVIRAAGSTPREVGAAMLVSATGFEGTIGGGNLEFVALKTARDLIDRRAEGAWLREAHDYPLGPQLFQCCGGYASVLFELFTTSEKQWLADLANAQSGRLALFARPLHTGVPLALVFGHAEALDWPVPALRSVREMLAGMPSSVPLLVDGLGTESTWFIELAEQPKVALYLYGAGHVGREIARVVAGLPFEMVWIDTARERFPEGALRHAHVAENPAELGEQAPAGAFHLVMTYSHALDQRICHAILKRAEFGFLGLIGSKTKRARFVQRFLAAGIDAALVERLVCPIGVAGVMGKEPAVIAVSTAAQLMHELRKPTKAAAQAKIVELTRS